jgi:large subunit ribosomal protein L10
MAITRQKKEEVVAKMTNALKTAKTLVFANFKGLTVAEQNELRKALRTSSVSYTVAKKTLIKRALDTAKYEGTLPVLDGEIAILAGEDEIAPAREMAVFVKKFGDHLSYPFTPFINSWFAPL